MENCIFLKKVRRSRAIFPLLAFQLFKYFFPPIPPFPSCCRIRAICLSSLFLWRGHFSPLHWEKKEENETRFVGEERDSARMGVFWDTSFCYPTIHWYPPGVHLHGTGVPVKQEVDSLTTTKTFPPLFFGKTPTPSGKRKTIFFFLGIPRPPDFLGQPSDSVEVPMCTLFCGPDSSGAMLDRSGRCAERKINGSTTPSGESGRSPPPSHF